MRTFISMELSQEVKDELVRVMGDLKKRNDAVRWVRPEGMHLTLKFLGEITGEQVPGLSRMLDEVAGEHGPLELAVEGLGAFPGTRRARVVWAGLEGQVEELVTVSREVDHGCLNLGFKAEKRPFRPHVTLGRRKIPSMIDLGVHMNRTAFTARALMLYRSELRPEGARYTVLHSSSFTQA